VLEDGAARRETGTMDFGWPVRGADGSALPGLFVNFTFIMQRIAYPCLLPKGCRATHENGVRAES